MLNPYLWYSLIFRLILPFALFRLLWRSRHDSRYRQHILQRLGLQPRSKTNTSCIWLHAVSVGEAHAARPLIAELRQALPNHRFHLTATTPTGAEVLQTYCSPGDTLGYFPFDTPGSWRRALHRVQPRLIIVMETELWPSFLHSCQEHDIPVLLANARLSERSLRRYLRIHRLIGPALATLGHVCSQSSRDAERFARLGLLQKRISISGNLKLDLLNQAPSMPSALLVTTPWVWMAASTHPEEEKIMIDTWLALQDRHPSQCLIWAPRHPQRCRAIQHQLHQYNIACHCRSAGLPPATWNGVYLIDGMGGLSTLYARTSITFVGGSLADYGGHNFLECIPGACAIIIGPYQRNFADLSQRFRQAKAVSCIQNSDDLAPAITHLWHNPETHRKQCLRAHHLLGSLAGGSAHTCQHILKLLNRPSTGTP